MADINTENISDLDLNGNDLFQDSESLFTELDDEEEFIIVGGHRKGSIRKVTGCVISDVVICGNTIGNCGDTAACGNTIADGE